MFTLKLQYEVLSEISYLKTETNGRILIQLRIIGRPFWLGLDYFTQICTF